MKVYLRLITTVPLLLVLALAAGCGGTSGSSAANEVRMNAADFEQTTITIKAGTALHLADEQSGTTHLLCLGKDGQCDPSAQGPTQLSSSNPLEVDPGQTKDITFDTPGTYAITCTIHPGMELTVTVQ
jgi:plastocyanin